MIKPSENKQEQIASGIAILEAQLTQARAKMDAISTKLTEHQAQVRAKLQGTWRAGQSAYILPPDSYREQLNRDYALASGEVSRLERAILKLKRMQ